MAIKFNSSNITNPTSNLYTIQEFKGVDYTTTPTLVDDSRAIEVSNYLPYNGALVKRNGWEVVNYFKHGQNKRLDVHNIWTIKKYGTNSKIDIFYIVFASEHSNDGVINPKLYYTTTLESDGIDYALNDLYTFVNPVEDLYSYGINFGGRLFLLLQESYLMVYFDGDTLVCKKVSEEAYIPTIVFGLGHTEGIETPTTLEEFNLLSNKCYIELLDYPKQEEQKTYIYDIGQFFNTDFAIKEINGEPFESGMDLEDIGSIAYDSENKTISVLKPAGNTVGDVSYIKVLIEYTKEENVIDKMKFGVQYGAYGYKDRLFLSGNPTKPNMDVHSCETHDEGNEWKDYTYFGDMSYQLFGSDNQKIIGYGIMASGQMVVFKESTYNEPNLYFRTADYQTDSEGNLKEIFPITVSGVKVDGTSNAEIISFGNDLLLNVANGIFRVDLTTSTAVQGYEVREVSYFIRDGLGKDISDSCSIVHNNKLYVCRKNYEGKKRVYVADINKYSYKDGHQIYEWWCLDNINAEKFFVFDDVLYFSDYDRGLCKFGDLYADKYVIENDILTVNYVNYSKDAFLDKNTNDIIITTDSKLYKDICNTTDLQTSLNNFRDTTKIRVDQDTIVKLEYLTVEETNEGFSFYLDESQYKLVEYGAFKQEENGTCVYFTSETDDTYKCSFESYGLITENGITRTYLNVRKEDQYEESPFVLTTGLGIWFDDLHQYDIVAIYDENKLYNLLDCFIEDNTWYQNYTDAYGNQYIKEIGKVDTLFFNRFVIGVCDTENVLGLTQETMSKVEFYITKPVESYWYSKYNDLGRLDYLKTASNIFFVPEVDCGGYTKVGYKTAKNDVFYYSSAERGHHDFEYIDFDNYHFGNVKMAKSYSSKKKIKNFSFIQLKLSSNENECSSIVSLSFRYKYTRNNKGVK